MTITPSDSLEKKLYNAKTGLWPEHLVSKKEVVLALKVPTNVIKAVYHGASCLAIISVIEAEQANIMCIGLEIGDEIENPFRVFQPIVTAEEQLLIEKLLLYPTFELHFFDENSRHLLGTTCSFDYSRGRKAIEEVKNISLFCIDHYKMEKVSTDFIETILHKLDLALDIFQEDINSPINGKPTMAITKHIISLSLTKFDQIPIYETTVGKFKLNDIDEGGGLEKSTYNLLEKIYRNNTFPSPQVQKKKVQRELTDLLGFDFDSNTICIVESKVMSVLDSRMNKPSKRRATSVEKQIFKGIKQLKGAILKIRSGNEICDREGRILNIPARDTSIVHAIVAISELYLFVDWQKVANELIEVSEQDRYRALFHVIDLKELQHIIAYSKEPKAFCTVLLQRWVEVKTKKTNYIKGKAPIEFYK